MRNVAGWFLKCAIPVAEAPAIGFYQSRETATAVHYFHVRNQRDAYDRIILTERSAPEPSQGQHSQQRPHRDLQGEPGLSSSAIS